MQYISNSVDRLKALLIAVIGTLLAFLIAISISSGSASPLEDPLRLNTDGSGGVQIEGSSVYYKESSSLHCVSSNGSFKWNMGVDNNARFSVSKYGVAVWSYKKFQIVDKNTGISKISTNFESDILSAKIGDAYAAIVLGPEMNSTVVITDLQGNRVDTITGLTELTVLDYGFFEGQNLFWLMTLDSTGSLPTCMVATYKPGRSETGNITDMEQVIYKVQFRQNHIYAVGTNYMRVYDYKGSELTDMRKTVYGYTLEAVNENNENPMMIFVPSSDHSDANNMKDMRVIQGTKETQLHFPVSCLSIKAKGDTIYGFAKDAVCVLKAGQTVPNVYRLPVSIDGVIGVTDDLTAVATFGNSIFMFKLP